MKRRSGVMIAPRSTAFVLMAAGAAMFAAWLVIPDERARAAIALRDGHYRDALVILEQTRPTESDPNHLVVLHRLYVRFGDHAKAGITLRRFVDENPAEVWALKELAAHYRHAHAREDYLGTLDELIDKEPDREAFSELMGQYRLYGDVNAELGLFEKGQRLGLANSDDVARAGLMYAALGKLERAADLLESARPIDESMRETVHHNLLGVLMDLSRFEDAVALAKEIERQSAGKQNGLLRAVFEAAGRPDLAAAFRPGTLTPSL